MAITRSMEEKRRKMLKFILLPFKVLGKVATFYTKCMEECSSKLGQDGFVLCPVPQVTTLPRSLSTFGASRERDDEVEELLKCVSKRRNESQVEPNEEVKGDNSRSRGVGISYYTLGVGILGTIDEEEEPLF